MRYAKPVAILIAVLVLAAVRGLLGPAPAEEGRGPRDGPAASATPPASGTTRELRDGAQVTGAGVVDRLLPDDNDGSRHQRFILRLDDGRTLLVAHNIDLAPRLTGLARGDTVRFSGEYETNDRGGVIHWTHRDPQGRHAAGWLEHAGRRVQ